MTLPHALECRWCNKTFRTSVGKKFHLVASSKNKCSEKERRRLARKLFARPKRVNQAEPSDVTISHLSPELVEDQEIPDYGQLDEDWRGVSPGSEAEPAWDLGSQDADQGPVSEPTKHKVPNISAPVIPIPVMHSEEFEPPAGQPITGEIERTPFEIQRETDKIHKQSVYGPMIDKDHWQMAKWMMGNGLTQAARDQYFKLEANRREDRYRWKNNKNFLKSVDALPSGATWKCEIITIVGDVVEAPGEEPATEHLEFWYRDVIQCLKELLSNPVFKDQMAFAPLRKFLDEDCTTQVFDEMWTGKWWWKIQELLPDGATLVPVILASDKTQLTRMSGDKQAWPVYLTIGNLSKELRRRCSSRATVLLAYLPHTKMTCFQSAARQQKERWKLFHYCLKRLITPIINLKMDGIEIVCADGLRRLCYPVISSYLADHPEQCSVCCVRENRCPRCNTRPNTRGLFMEHTFRTLQTTLDAIKSNKGDALKKLGFRPTWPFWAKLPRCNPHMWHWPDNLHQYMRGMFTEHLVAWIKQIVGEKELDARFKVMTPFSGLRHFLHGISVITQWTGNEGQMLIRIFMAVVVDSIADNDVILATRALVDFGFYAYLHQHTSDTIKKMQECLETFHQYKAAFQYNRGTTSDFNFPKMHSLLHFPKSIPLIGSLDQTDTNGPERLHIDFSKLGYRASNKKHYYSQMTKWLDRQTAIHEQSTYLTWSQGQQIVADTDEVSESGEEDGGGEDEDDGEDDGEGVSEDNGANRCGIFVSKRPHALHVNIDTLEDNRGHGIINFIGPLNRYLTDLRASSDPKLDITATEHDYVDTWSSARIHHGQSYALGRSEDKQILRAKPPKPALKDPRASTHGTFDTALLLGTDPEAEGLHRYRVCQVRALFRLPPKFGSASGSPLAFVELFSPFTRTAHAVTGFFQVTRSIQAKQPVCRVVPVASLHYVCHLTPKLGRTVDRNLKSASVLENASQFYFNHYITRRLWVLKEGLNILGDM